MSFKSICPHCKQHYELEDDIQGQVAECTKCGREFTIVPMEKPVLFPISDPFRKTIAWTYCVYVILGIVLCIAGITLYIMTLSILDQYIVLSSNLHQLGIIPFIVSGIGIFLAVAPFCKKR